MLSDLHKLVVRGYLVLPGVGLAPQSPLGSVAISGWRMNQGAGESYPLERNSVRFSVVRGLTSEKGDSLQHSYRVTLTFTL